MDGITSDFKDEFEQSLDVVKRQIKQEPKKFLASAKAQVLGNQQSGQSQAQQLQPGEIQKIEASQGKQSSTGQKQVNDPVTGLPKPSKPMVTVLQQELKQLDNAKKMQVKQELAAELEKQRMRNTEEETKSIVPGAGPVVPKDKKPKVDPKAVQRMMQNAKSTGESRGGDLVG